MIRDFETQPRIAQQSTTKYEDIWVGLAVELVDLAAGSACALGLYSYSFDSQAAPFRGFTLTVVGRNE